SGGALDDRFEVDLRDLVRELLLLEEVEQVRIAVYRRFVEVAADGDRHEVGDGADVLDDSIEGPLPAAKWTHPVVRVAVAVERDLHTGAAVLHQSLDHLPCEKA